MDKEFKDEFEKIHQKFDAIDVRFDGVDQKFGGIDQRFGALDQRFDAVDKRFGALDQRFDDFEEHIDAQLTENVEIIGKIIDNRFEAFRNEFASQVVTHDILDKKLSKFASANGLKVRDDNEEYSS